jgi:flagellar protein FlbD
VGLTALIVRLVRPRGDAGALAPVVALRARQTRAALHAPPEARSVLVPHERNRSMIKLHHGRERREIWVNADLIETIESTPDTVIKLTTDRRLIVSETPEEIAALVLEFRRRIGGRPHVLSGG